MSAAAHSIYHDCGIISPHYSRHVEGQVSPQFNTHSVSKMTETWKTYFLRPRQGISSHSLEIPLQYFVCPHSLWKLPKSAQCYQDKNILGPDLILMHERHFWMHLLKSYPSWDQPGPSVTPVCSPIPDCYLYGILFFFLISGIHLTFHPEHGIIKVLPRKSNMALLPGPTSRPTSRQVA